MNIVIMLLAMQLQRHPPSDLNPQSCQDRISAQRHYFLDAARRSREPQQLDALMGWYADTANAKKVAYACSSSKNEAEVMLRVEIARYFILTEPKSK
jgi:hypothetical protein